MPFYGGPVYVPPPHPAGSGYGGVGFGYIEEGGAYGTNAYGGMDFAAPKVNVSGGYGGDPFGHGPYGSTEKEPPRIISAVSISGWEIEVFFSEEMDPANPLLTDPSAYTITDVVGGPSTVLSVTIEELGPVDVYAGDTFAGVLSVVLLHTGTMLGGTYQINANGPTDIAGNPILGAVPAALLTRGSPPQFTVSVPASGTAMLLQFDHDMLPAAEHPAGSTTIGDAASYVFSSDPVYPILPTIEAVTHPVGGDPSQVLLTVRGQTSLEYTLDVSPAEAFDYDGSVLPNEDPNLDGTEVNPGGGSSVISSGQLLLTRLVNKSYGWDFRDISGTVTPTTSAFRADFTFNAGAASYHPPLVAFPSFEMGELYVEDGPSGNGVQVRLLLGRTAIGAEYLRVRSGIYDQTFPVTWTTGTHTLSVVRNSKAQIYAVLFDGLPLTATAVANFTGVSTASAAGMSWTLFDEPFRVGGFQVHKVEINSTTTVYSAAWNFLHDVLSTFTGSATLTRDTLLTQRGPLVKGWGDATPATDLDVVVKVVGTEVEVSAVNPYIGAVQVEVPIPLLPLGDAQADVSVDYKWFQSPVMELSGLNTPGLVLNKWDRHRGHHDPPAHGEQVQDSTHAKGAVDEARFQMGVALAPYDRPTPLLIGHRYIGFERDYSATLNSPTTLLLNQSPYQTAVDPFERDQVGVSVAFEGTSSPIEGDDPWNLDGSDAGHVNLNEGTYTVIDDQTGTLEPGVSNTTIYWRPLDLSYPQSLFLVGRFRVEETVLDGVFTGVGFGAHDNHRVYLAGALQVNGLQHVGLLRNANRMDHTEGWDIGPNTSVSIESSTTVRMVTAEIPPDIEVADQFQILTGTQRGIYRVAHVAHGTDGYSLITTTTEFPADPTRYGNKYPTVYFETPWADALSTYRLEINLESGVAELSLSGGVTGTIATVDANNPDVPEPSDSALLLRTEGEGQVFWGSLGRETTNEAEWTFYRYGTVPAMSATRSRAITAATEMGDLPENDPNNEWFISRPFGFSEIDATRDRVLVKGTTADEALEFSFDYRRIEHFYTPEAILDIRTRFQVESGNGDVAVLDDTDKQTRLGALLYVEDPAATTYRQLIHLPSTSLTGMMLPESQDWKVSGTSTLGVQPRGSYLGVFQDPGEEGLYYNNIPITSAGIGFTDGGGRIIEGRLAVRNFSGDVGIRFGGDVGLPGDYRFVGLRLRGGVTPGVQVVTSTGVVQEYDFDWADQGMHTYRLVADEVGGVVTVILDDTVQTPTINISQFTGGAGNTGCYFGAEAVSSITASVVLWDSVSSQVLPPTSAKRTIGIWTGGDRDLITSWEIPRTDTSTAPNDARVGPVIEEMDWRDEIEVRILRSPGWGITVYRPDMPLPPYYSPETPGVPGTGFITTTAEPSAGWINVEYSQLPRTDSTFGFVSFGALSPDVITQQRWDWVRYKLSLTPTEDYHSPEHMVLNQYNVIASGERTKDVTPEQVSIQTLDTTRLSLLPTHLFADRVFKVIDGTTSFTPEMYTFDQGSQLLTLIADANGVERHFSGTHVAVTVYFSPGKPTTTYLTNQPLLDGITKLNVGTPPVPKSQVAEAEQQQVFGSLLNDPTDTLGDPDFLLNDPYRIMSFVDPVDAVYEDLTFLEVDNGGETDLLSTFCDGGGVAEIELEGTMFWEGMAKPVQQYTGGGGAPGTVLFASGGSFVGPVVNSSGGVIAHNHPLGGTLGPALPQTCLWGPL